MIEQHQVDGVDVVVMEIVELPVDQKPCYLRSRGLMGGAYIRIGDSNRQLTQYEVQVTLASHGQPLDDIKPSDATRGDLDDTHVAHLLAELRGRGSSYAGMTDDEILRALRVLVPSADGERVVVSRAGLLTLGTHPQQFYPHARATFVSYPTDAIGDDSADGQRFLDNAAFDGSIGSIVEQALSRLKSNMRRGSVVRGAHREDQWEYPETAIREAVVNALVHRHLSEAALGTPVQIQMFPDRLVIQNPGGLHGPVSVDELGDAGVSSARNGFLLRILEDLPPRVCENRGSGIGAMVAAMRSADLRPPEFEDHIGFFRVTFPNHTLMSEATSTWLAQLPHIDLSEPQRVGLALMRDGGPVTNTTYRRATGTDSRVATRELADLVARGLAMQTGVRRWATYELAPGSAPEQMPLTVRVEVTPSRVEAPQPLPNDEVNTEARILDAIRRLGPLSRQHIENELRLPARSARFALDRLIASGRLVPTELNPRSPKQRYRVPGQSDGPTRTTV